jgi:hypothetical protein
MDTKRIMELLGFFGIGFVIGALCLNYSFEDNGLNTESDSKNSWFYVKATEAKKDAEVLRKKFNEECKDNPNKNVEECSRMIKKIHEDEYFYKIFMESFSDSSSNAINFVDQTSHP